MPSPVEELKQIFDEQREAIAGLKREVQELRQAQVRRGRPGRRGGHESKRIGAIARRKLDEWLAWASRSRLAPFVKLGRTIRKHRDGILEYVRDRLNNGRVEGLNGKIRTITRRAYGFHSAASLISPFLTH